MSLGDATQRGFVSKQIGHYSIEPRKRRSFEKISKTTRDLSIDSLAEYPESKSKPEAGEEENDFEDDCEAEAGDWLQRATKKGQSKSQSKQKVKLHKKQGATPVTSGTIAPVSGEWGVPEPRPGRAHWRDTDAAEGKEQE